MIPDLPDSRAVTAEFSLPWSEGTWRRLLAEAYSDPRQVLEAVGLDPTAGDDPAVAAATAQLPCRVPRGFVARMRPGDRDDPLLRQVLPVAEETRPASGFGCDPVGEQAAGVRAGVLRKYRGRALLVTTGTCAVHCRYCFRRHYPYDDGSALAAGWEPAVAAVAGDDTVTEVILSGGDPLALADGPLAGLVARVAEVERILRLRLHTRVPVVLPERVDGSLLRVLEAWPRQLVVVLHANHPAEVVPEVEVAVAALRAVGATVLNQAVLLAGVNDRSDTLCELSERLFAAGVLPYYLHLLDPVAGAAHFDVDAATGRRLLGEVAARLPGYLVPRLVREVDGAPAKVQHAFELP